jgi:uncharacterized membrane protein
MKKIKGEEFWDAFGRPQVVNIVSIVAIITSFISTIVSLFIQVRSGQSSSMLIIFPIIIFVAIIILIFFTLTNIRQRNHNRKKYQIIEKLSGLQNKYIQSADFKTLAEYDKLSREEELGDKGQAKILTNSLSYDMYYCDTIAKNLFKGAGYTYFLSRDEDMLRGLKNFIYKLHNELYNKNNYSGTPITGDEVNNILKNKVEFWLFNTDILCLYNFSRFRQDGESPFIQSWWYVNSKDHNNDSYMLSHEIKEPDDIKELNNVFEHLKLNIKFSKSAYDIYEERDRLESLYGERIL